MDILKNKTQLIVVAVVVVLIIVAFVFASKKNQKVTTLEVKAPTVVAEVQ